MKKVFKRISTNISASFNSFCDRIENHEAVAQSLLEDAQNARARFKVRLQRVQRDTESLRQRIRKLETDVGQWKERALAVHADDQPKALECLKRSKRAETELEPARAELAAQEKTECDLHEGVRQIEIRIEELRRRKHTLSAREIRAHALREQAAATGSVGDDIESLFERWEIRVSEAEFSADSPQSTDPLETEFVKQEETEELTAELEALVQESESKSDPS